MSRNSRYLTYTDRLIIEKMYMNKCPNRQIAIFLDVHPSTISREIKRGLYERMDPDFGFLYTAYSADVAQQNADYNQTAKGRPLKIGNDRELADHIEREILSGKSPDVIIHQLKERPFSTVTLYRYIHMGLFLNITAKNLIEYPTRKRKYTRVKASRPPKGTSIEQRPKHINDREEFGHWEMDSVIGKKSGKYESLLVLTERKTRFELVFHLRDKTASQVVHALDNILSKFPKGTFKTITVDNGAEFHDAYGMEYDKDGNRRTSVYYCHPYSSCERGSNERMNRMLRRFFPKGQSLSKVTQKECNDAAHWLNTYPRKILNYHTPEELFQAELALLA